MKLKCEYCQRLRTNDEPCPGCGQTGIAEVSERHESEFFHKGYFVKCISNSLVNQNMEYYFFRGRDLIDRIEINWRNMMHLREAEGLRDGEDYFYLIWEMFEASQMEKHGVVKTYENDPRFKRI